jgi:hypothetical protein
LSRIAPLLTIGLFVAGVVLGVLVFAAVNPPPPPNPYPGVPPVAEPPVAAALARALANDDADTLAQAADDQTLQVLGEALQPLVEVTDVKFVRAVGVNRDTLAAYVASGRDSQGGEWSVGLVLRVQGDQLVGVN